jgi:hypothetical protein
LITEEHHDWVCKFIRGDLPVDVSNQEDNEFEGETIIERMAKLAGELSGDHDRVYRQGRQ